MNKTVAIAGGAALVGLALLAANKGLPGGGGGATKLTISGQSFFNSLPAAQQQSVLAKLFTWYQNVTTAGKFPPSVQDPGITSAGALTDPGNFGIVVDAFQTVNNVSSSGGPGVLDVITANTLGAT